MIYDKYSGKNTSPQCVKYGFRSSAEEEMQVVSLILENVTGHLFCSEATVKNNGTVCWHILVQSVECPDQVV
jgi:hypothetical protein